MLQAHKECYREPDTDYPVNFVCLVHGKVKSSYFGLKPFCPTCAKDQDVCMVCNKPMVIGTRCIEIINEID